MVKLGPLNGVIGPSLALSSHEYCPIETIFAWLDSDEEVSRDGLEPVGKVCRKKIETVCWKSPSKIYRSSGFESLTEWIGG